MAGSLTRPPTHYSPGTFRHAMDAGMKIADWLLGLILLACGALIVWEARGFPAPMGQLYGAAFFPTIIGCGMALVGLLMTVKGLREARPGLVRFDQWQPSLATFGRLALPVILTVGIMLAMPHTGFLASAITALLIFQLCLGVRWFLALPIALIGAVTISYVFGTLLRVALPYGPLERLIF